MYESINNTLSGRVSTSTSLSLAGRRSPLCLFVFTLYTPVICTPGSVCPLDPEVAASARVKLAHWLAAVQNCSTKSEAFMAELFCFLERFTSGVAPKVIVKEI